MTQAPFEHVAEAFAKPEHVLPQLPQFWGSVSTFVSQPLALLWSQLAKPAEQVLWQVPFEQTGEPFATVGQTFPHAPQFCGSELVFAVHGGGGNTATSNV